MLILCICLKGTIKESKLRKVEKEHDINLLLCTTIVIVVIVAIAVVTVVIIIIIFIMWVFFCLCGASCDFSYICVVMFL